MHILRDREDAEVRRMSTWAEGFENGALGTNATTGNTVFDDVTEVVPGGAVFVASPVHSGDQAYGPPAAGIGVSSPNRFVTEAGTFRSWHYVSDTLETVDITALLAGLYAGTADTPALIGVMAYSPTPAADNGWTLIGSEQTAYVLQSGWVELVMLCSPAAITLTLNDDAGAQLLHTELDAPTLAGVNDFLSDGPGYGIDFGAGDNGAVDAGSFRFYLDDVSFTPLVAPAITGQASGVRRNFVARR